MHLRTWVNQQIVVKAEDSVSATPYLFQDVPIFFASFYEIKEKKMLMECSIFGLHLQP